MRALLPRVIAQFGQVDAVVNSAALFEHDSAASFSYAAMERHLRTNTGAAILLAQALHAPCAERAAGAKAPATARAWWSTCWTRSCGTRTRIS